MNAHGASPGRQSEDAAIVHLAAYRLSLVDSGNSIAAQEEELERLRSQVSKAEEKLARDKKALIQVDAALGVLRAGR